MNLPTILDPISEMAYPAEFSMDKLKSIRSYKGRCDYVASMLPLISSGSSRKVYRVDDEKVLKVAKNPKGLAQNESEGEGYKQNWDVVARVFDADDDFYFVEMELATKVTPNIFKRVVGISLQELDAYLRDLSYRRDGKRYGGVNNPKLYDELDIENNEWVKSLEDLVINYDYPIPGDFSRASTYGLVHRPEGEAIVIIDFGLTREVLDTHYSPKRPANRY